MSGIPSEPSRPTLTQSIVRSLVAARWPLLVVACLVAIAAWQPATQVRFDRRIERMFSADDPLLPPYERLKSRFGGNEVVMAVYRDPDLLAPDGSGLARLAAVSQRMKEVPGVRDVLSLAQVNALLEELEPRKVFGDVLQLFGNREQQWHGPAILNPDSPLAKEYCDLFAGYTHSADGRTAAVVCMLQPSPETSRGATIARLDEIVRHLPDALPAGVLAGEPVMVVEGFELLEEDGRRLWIWTSVLLGLTILILFRSLRWLVMPIAIVQWTLLATRALLVVSGLELSMVSSMLTAIVTVVGVATVMHLIVHVREMRTQGIAPRAAFVAAGTMLLGPICGAILTDVAGFGSLWCATVGPVRDFGTMMVLGSLLVIPAIALLVPALALAGARDTGKTTPGWGEGQLASWLMRSVDAIQARPRPIAAVTFVVSLLAAVGAWRLEVETDFTRNFRQGSRVVAAYEFVETQLGGAGVWDVVVPAPKTLDKEYLARVRALEEKLRAITVPDPATGKPVPALTKVISLADALKAAEVDPVAAAIPVEARARALAELMPTFLGALRSTELDQHGEAHLRIMLRARERQPAEQKRQLIEQVTKLAQAEFPPSDTSAGGEVTGFFVLLTNLIESLLRDQWVTFAVASTAIAAMVWIGFRSWQYALIALIPNVVPIFIVMGLLGWIGLKINMGAAMIAAVSMGMSVDSSIHYFASFRRARRAGKSAHEALLVCQQSVGTAMIFSTLGLIVGFGVLITSEFVPTVYFGALMSLAMLGGMTGNLIVLPLLLSWVERDR